MDNFENYFNPNLAAVVGNMLKNVFKLRKKKLGSYLANLF